MDVVKWLLLFVFFALTDTPRRIWPLGRAIRNWTLYIFLEFLDFCNSSNSSNPFVDYFLPSTLLMVVRHSLWQFGLPLQSVESLFYWQSIYYNRYKVSSRCFYYRQFITKATWGRSDRAQLKIEKNVRPGWFATMYSIIMSPSSEHFCSCGVTRLVTVALTLTHSSLIVQIRPVGIVFTIYNITIYRHR